MNAAALAALLVEMVLGEPQRAASAAERIAADGAWRAAAALATRWRLLPALAQRVAALDTAFAPDPLVAASLRAQAAVSAVRSGRAVREAADVQRELAAAGVAAVAIEGVAAIATLYRDPALRAVSDIDIMIRPADLAVARAALTAAGYIDRSPPFELHMLDIAHSRGLHNFARTFVRNGFEIDLQWQFGPRPPAGLDADRIVGRAQTADVDGRRLEVAGPVESALILVHHALRGGFAASSTVKDLVDLARWWETFGPRWSDELLATAHCSGLASSLLALLLALAAEHPDHPAAAAIVPLESRLDRSERAEARRLCAFFDDAIAARRPDDATIELFAPKVYVRSLWLAARGALAPEPRGAYSAARRPLIVRVLRRLERGWRIGRDLAQHRRLASYRAVARAQSRFH